MEKTRFLSFIDQTYFMLNYHRREKRLIHKLKITQSDNLVQLVRHLYGGFLAQNEGFRHEFSAVVPIPSHHNYGRNQENTSGVLSKSLSRMLGLPVHKIIRRNGSMAKQSSLPKLARRRNVQGAFRLKTRQIRYQKILLVDDMITTGSTASECARLLKDAGAKKVGVFALARGQLS